MLSLKSINLNCARSRLRSYTIASFAIVLLTAGAPMSQSSAAAATPISAGATSVRADSPRATSDLVLPDTKLGRQTAWLIEVSRRLPAPHTEILSHFNPVWRSAVSTVGFNQALAENSGPNGLTPLCYQELSPKVAEIVAIGSKLWTVTVTIDEEGYLMTAGFRPYGVTSHL